MTKSIKVAAILLPALILQLVITPGKAAATTKTGVHLLSTQDLAHAKQLLAAKDGEHFVTIPLTFSDLNRHQQWQQFFDQCRQEQFAPIIRLATESQDGVWIKPNRRQIVQMFEFLDSLDWPTEELYLIVFNEVNHAQEWGGEINPREYARVLEFTSYWARTEPREYVVLPAAMDLAAPNGPSTMEAFTYLDQMYQANPRVFDYIDLWNSHSYPNPGFSSSPVNQTKNSMRGFIHELNYLKRKTGRDLEVLITETGWKANAATLPWLDAYYLYAFQHIWSHPRVVGVTPFVVQGSPGPFAEFSFFDRDGEPTAQFKAFTEALKTTASP